MDTSYDFPKSRFYDALITGFFVGFFATLLCLIYNIIFRESTGFSMTPFISVSTIIFAVNIIFPIIGIVYYAFLHSFRKPDVGFAILFVMLTAVLAWRAEHIHRSDIHLLNAEFRNLLFGIVIILGVSASVFIPVLFHSKKFHETVL